jgi:hypothetical protein
VSASLYPRGGHELLLQLLLTLWWLLSLLLLICCLKKCMAPVRNVKTFVVVVVVVYISCKKAQLRALGRTTDETANQYLYGCCSEPLITIFAQRGLHVRGQSTDVNFLGMCIELK